MADLTLAVPEALIDAVASRVAALISNGSAQTNGRWLSVEEAAEYLRTTPAALRKAIARKQVPAHQPYGRGTRYLLHTTELDGWAFGA